MSEEGPMCCIDGCHRKATRGLKISDLAVCRAHFYGRYPCSVCQAPSAASVCGEYLCGAHRNIGYKYGMTVSEMKLMDWMKSAGVLCPVCGERPVEVVDHNHFVDSPRPRAALCQKCNTRTMFVAENHPEWYERARAIIDIDTESPESVWQSQLEEAERRMDEDA